TSGAPGRGLAGQEGKSGGFLPPGQPSWLWLAAPRPASPASPNPAARGWVGCMGSSKHNDVFSVSQPNIFAKCSNPGKSRKMNGSVGGRDGGWAAQDVPVLHPAGQFLL